MTLYPSKMGKYGWGKKEVQVVEKGTFLEASKQAARTLVTGSAKGQSTLE